jgi:hypothetical protein
MVMGQCGPNRQPGTAPRSRNRTEFRPVAPSRALRQVLQPRCTWVLHWRAYPSGHRRGGPPQPPPVPARSYSRDARGYCTGERTQVGIAVVGRRSRRPCPPVGDMPLLHLGITARLRLLGGPRPAWSSLPQRSRRCNAPESIPPQTGRSWNQSSGHPCPGVLAAGDPSPQPRKL